MDDQADFLIVATESEGQRPGTPTMTQDGQTEDSMAETQPHHPTFSGKPEESVANFVQSVQKVAFEQDRSTDDRWISTYVGTCLSDGAMLWYISLDDRTRNNRSKLRKALVTRYNLSPPAAATPADLAQRQLQLLAMQHMVQQRSRGLAKVAQPIFQQSLGGFPTREKAPNELRGRIEVFVPEGSLWLGFLACQYAARGVVYSVCGTKNGSALVGFVPDPQGRPVQMRVESVPCDPNYPYVGVAFDDPGSQARLINPFTGGFDHPLQTGIGQLPNVGAGVFPTPQMGYPHGPAQNVFQPPTAQSASINPSWSLKPCTESHLDERYHRAAKTCDVWETAAAAVWTYDPNTKEMGVVWMNSDGSEDRLAVSVTKLYPTIQDVSARLILHKGQEGAGVADGLQSPPQNLPAEVRISQPNRVNGFVGVPLSDAPYDQRSMTSQITESMQVADSAEPDLSSIPWLDFSGSPDESVGTFIKSVQRVALMKQRTHQDQWIAHYAAGCFDNDALIWYSDLDEDTCNSWRKLRKALLERYHPMARESGSQAAARIFRPSDLQVRAPAVQRVEPPSASTPAMRGRVEVFRYEYPESLGYLSSGCLLSISFRSFSIVVKDQNQGLIVSFPQDSQESPFDLSRTDNQMYGLGMSSQDGYLVLSSMTESVLRLFATKKREKH
ncbi:hypothetical protein FRB90_005286 [Tulasnella sp. 427]|nr:hypothetical protein FRB90_005286 [Tulasnella sp. 427]